VVSFTPDDNTLLSTEQEAGWAQRG